jgi:hypothetical protein
VPTTKEREAIKEVPGLFDGFKAKWMNDNEKRGWQWG